MFLYGFAERAGFDAEVVVAAKVCQWRSLAGFKTTEQERLDQ
jgi:hypothetical protein